MTRQGGGADLAPITGDDGFREAHALEMEVWGYQDPLDAVPPQMLAALVSAGGLLVGAREGGRLVGFAFSFPAICGGETIQWSHTLAVRPDHRQAGLARRLKLAQRDQALAMGITRIQWTFDPLQAVNAHFNLHRLGATASRYLVDAYGDSSSPLHRGVPTDRLVADWQLSSARVVSLAAGQEAVRSSGAPGAGESGQRDRGAVGRATGRGEGGTSGRPPQVRLEIAMGFSERLVAAPAEALAARLATREAFTRHFGAGLRAVDFEIEPAAGRGAYLFAPE